MFGLSGPEKIACGVVVDLSECDQASFSAGREVGAGLWWSS